MTAPPARARLAGVVAALALLAALPWPRSMDSGANVALLTALALGLAFQAWAVWYRRDWVLAVWVFCSVLALLLAWREGFWLSAVLQGVWGLWVRQRAARGAFAWLLCLSVGARAQTQTDSTPSLPTHLQGQTLEGLSSCLEIDKLPWAFRKTQRQSRFLIRDHLKLNTNDQPDDFVLWEVHQVMDKHGESAFIFRRPLPNGVYEVYVTKGTLYNRIADAPGSRKILRGHKYKNLVDRPVLTFNNRNGSTLVFKPGSGGRGQLVLNFKGHSFIPPLVIMGTSCERIGADGEDPFGNDEIGGAGFRRKSGAAPGAPAAPAAPGANP